MPIGWPLGLSFLNVGFRVVEASAQPYSLHVPSTSFSSFSSSNLDTESTASFFKDNSVSLAQLIGVRPGDTGQSYFPNSLRFVEQREKKLAKGSDMSRAICIPILLDTLLKICKRKKRSRKN